MDRNREARRASIVGSNGFNRRRHRTNSLRDSPDEEGGLEVQESARLRDRVKKDRDRERERERDRERDLRERERDRDLRERSSRSKRRRAERLTTNREDIVGDETSEESVNDEEDEEDEENAAGSAGGGVRLVTPVAGSISNHHHHQGHLNSQHHSNTSSFSQQQHNSNSPSNNIIGNNHHLQHRKSFPPTSSAAKVFRAPPVWKSGDEMISVSVPRKARSVSTKRSHDWISSSSNNNSGGGVSGGDQIILQESSSPVRQGVALTSTPSPSPSPAPAAPVSPTCSNASMRKKPKPNVNNNSGPKLKPPKVSSKPSSSNNEELEIEIAEVLYGLKTQPQGPSSKKEDSKEVNRSNSDMKSRNSSPISNSAAANNSNLAPTSSPLSAVAPKRKRPRQVQDNSSHGGRSSLISTKPDPDQMLKSEISSPNPEKISGSVTETSVNSSGQPPAPEPSKLVSDLKPVADELMEDRDLVAKEEVTSPKEKVSPAARAEISNSRDSPSTATTMIKGNSVGSEMENQKAEKFEIDLMAPPPQGRSSVEREMKIDSDKKPVLSLLEADLKPTTEEEKYKEDEKSKSRKDHSANVSSEVKKGGEEGESHRKVENKVRNIDLHLDLEKPERDSNAKQQTQKQLQYQVPVKPTREELNEKSGHLTSSVPLPMSMANWPGGGLPPMGYMAPLQGVVSMDGANVSPAHIQPLFSQPRPKRCATHCHIARNIHCLQQFMKINPFWPAPAGSASLFGSKPCNLNVIPATDVQVSVPVKDKGQSVTNIPNHIGKEKGSQTVSTTTDSAQRKQQQILIQQALPPVAPSNLLGPAFIFPLNQQQAALGARPGAAKTPTTGASSNPSSSAAATNASSAATAMSFNYPNMGANETQYLAILQNNGYPFPIPTVGAPPNYRGTPAQAMPLFNGSFYPTPMIHPSQLQHQHQQQQQQQPSTQAQQLLQSHQNASASNGSSSSQKNLQSQQQRPQSSGSGSANMQNFPSQKTHPSHQLQQSHNHYMHASRPRHLEGETGGEDSPSTNDTRGSRPPMNVYGQNFSMPVHPQNFALMTPPALASASSGSSDQNEKKGHKQQGLKTGVDSLPPHSFEMSFGSINGATAGPGIDMTSMAQNHGMFHCSSEASRQNIQMMAAAAQAAAQVAQKNYRISEDGKSGGVDSSSADDERKILAGKALGGVGQSIAFTRSDLADAPATSAQSNSVVESSVRSSGPARSSRPMTTNAMGAMNITNAHIQAQIQQHQHQMMELKHQQFKHMQQQQQQHQQQMAANATRSKVPGTGNGNMYSEHLNSSSNMAAKFPNPLSGFPQNLVQNSSSPAQSPQWKGSTRTPSSQAPSSMSLNGTTLKNLPQQHSRTQTQMHTQISFGGNQKPSTPAQGQGPPNSNTSPSSPMMVGSPTTSSISKGQSGSPRTTTSSGNNKMGQASSLSAQPAKNSQSMANQKSPSILGNPHIASSGSNSGAKIQMQQQAQQQLPKGMQQAQLFFSNPYSQSQPPHGMSTSSATSGPSGYYMQQRRRPDQYQQAPGGPTSSSGMLSLCTPATMASTSTNDPAKAIAAATCNAKGGGLPSQGMIHASQFSTQPTAGTLLPAGFSYVHPVPAAVQVKPAEQKQPGNDNLHQWQPEKK